MYRSNKDEDCWGRAEDGGNGAHQQFTIELNQ